MTDRQFSGFIKALGEIKKELGNINTAVNAVAFMLLAMWIYSILDK